MEDARRMAVFRLAPELKARRSAPHAPGISLGGHRAEAHAEGKTRWGEITPEGRAAIVAANKGKLKSEEQCAKTNTAQRQVQKANRLERYQALIARCRPIFNARQERTS
jgi:hypothetical protein